MTNCSRGPKAEGWPGWVSSSASGPERGLRPADIALAAGQLPRRAGRETSIQEAAARELSAIYPGITGKLAGVIIGVCHVTSIYIDMFLLIGLETATEVADNYSV